MSKNSGLNFPGIYTITRIASGSVYIGQATNIRIRWQHHNRSLRRGHHRNFVLQRAWNEHGPEAFVFAVVKDMRDVPLNELQEALNAAEIALLTLHPRAYNLMEAGVSGTIASASTRALLSHIRKNQWADPIYRAKQRASIMALYADPEWKAARDAAVKIGKNSAKTKTDVSAQMKALWKTSDHKTAQSAKRTANWQDPAYREQQSASRKAAWADPTIRASRLAALKAGWAKRKAAKLP